MTNLTLFVKAFNPRQLKQVEDLLKNEIGELDLEISVSAHPTNKWVQVTINGEDEAIATNYIKQKIGTCPANLKNVAESSVLKGYISKVDLTKEELIIDVGVFQPKIVQALISLKSIRSQLVDGTSVDLKKISEAYSLHEGLPVSVKITALPKDEAGLLQAEFSAEQLEKIRLWQRSLLDRLIVLRASLSEIEAVVERTHLERDVIGIEDLGLFEHALTCKLGTDAAGLVSQMGRYMRNAVFVVYNPRKIPDFVGEKALNL
jgi:hypothetical protein